MGNKILLSIILLVSVLLGGCSLKNIQQENQLQISTEKNKTCEDVGGRDFYNKGHITVCDFTTLEEPGGPPVGCALHEDFCPTDFDDPTGKELYEYYCEGNELKFEKYTCLTACQDGACIK